MNKKTSVIIICMILLLAIMPFVSSAPPVTTIPQFTTGYIVEYPSIDYIKQGQFFDFHFHVFNISDGKSITNAGCTFHLYNQTGNHLYKGYDDVVSNEFDYSFKIEGGNFTNIGIYYFITQCNTTNLGGYVEKAFEVTRTGFELTVGRSIVDIGLLASLIIFLIISIYIFITFDNLLARVGMLGVIYLHLIAISFISWNMALDFLVSSPFIASMFRILFLTLMIGALPLLIGAFVWYFLMLWKIKEIQRLMDKGFSFEESKRRIK